MHHLGDLQRRRMTALKRERSRQALDLLLQAFHAQLATAQLEDLLAQSAVLLRQVVPPPEAGARRGEAVRARVDGAGDRPEAPQRRAFEKVRGAAAVRLLRRDQKQLTHQQDSEEQTNTARAHEGSRVFRVAISGSKRSQSRSADRSVS